MVMVDPLLSFTPRRHNHRICKSFHANLYLQCCSRGKSDACSFASGAPPWKNIPDMQTRFGRCRDRRSHWRLETCSLAVIADKVATYSISRASDTGNSSPSIKKVGPTEYVLRLRLMQSCLFMSMCCELVITMVSRVLSPSLPSSLGSCAMHQEPLTGCDATVALCCRSRPTHMLNVVSPNQPREAPALRGKGYDCSLLDKEHGFRRT